MQNSLRELRQTINTFLTLLVFAGIFPTTALAAYVFSKDTARSQYQIVLDVQQRNLDSNGAVPGVLEKLLSWIENPGPVIVNGQPVGGPISSGPLLRATLASRLQKVCPVISVQNGYGRQHAFRSLHRKGALDWIVTTTTDTSEKVTAIMVAPRTKASPIGGPGRSSLAAGAPLPPTMLPVPEGPIRGSVEMGCLSRNDFELARRERMQACETYRGGWCPQKQK